MYQQYMYQQFNQELTINILHKWQKPKFIRFQLKKVMIKRILNIPLANFLLYFGIIVYLQPTYVHSKPFKP